jgi:hypothetical protein
MAIHFLCACGRKLRAQDDFEGKRIRCPSCGQVSAVPAHAEETAAVPKRSPPQDTVDDDAAADEGQEPARARPRALRRKKKRKKERARVAWGPIEILGIPLTVRTGIAAGFFLLLVAGVVSYFVSLYRVKIVDVRRVDVYAALDVANRNIGKEFLGMQTSRLFKPGSQKFLIVRDSPDGQALWVHLKLPPKFLAAHTNVMHGTLMIDGKSFLLQGDGPPVEALLLDLERDFTDASTGVNMEFANAVNGDPVLPRHRPPWKPEGETTKNYRDEVVKIKSDHLEGTAFTCIGKAHFQGKSGMEVNYDYQGVSLTLTWDPGSRGYFAQTEQEFLDRFMLESLELVCVFPRPSGKQLTLTVLGKKIGTIHPR